MTQSMKRWMLAAVVAVPPADVEVPIADGFDYPVGIPDGNGWYVCQDFQDSTDNTCVPHSAGTHLGEDWNKAGGDEGQPVYAIANGVIIRASYTSGWGRVIMIKHSLFPGSEYSYAVSLYGHLGSDQNNQNYRDFSIGDGVRRGEIIGYIGSQSENGGYSPHLHFEIRSPDAINDPGCSAGVDNCLNNGYESNPIGWLDPTDASYDRSAGDSFIDNHRPHIMPIVGDWDGNNIDTTGTFDPRTSRFSLDSGINLQMGEPGDLPIVGDWNGDGTDTIGVYRPRTAEF